MGGDFQTISDTLQQLPHQLLGAGISGDGSRRRGRVSGDHTYTFTLHFEPRSEGGGLCQTGVLVATGTTTKTGQPLALNCSWQRRIGARLTDIAGFTGNMYHTSADDIGMEIVCHAETPPGAHFEEHGRATGEIGPFELDPITRLSLENVISSGGSRFPVRHFREEDAGHPPRDLQIHVTQDCVKVVHPGPERGNHEVIAHYTADYPKVVLSPIDTCKFRLEQGEEADKIYHFEALSRTSRDLIALLIRCFHSRRYVATSFILSRLFQNPAKPGVPLTKMTGDSFNVHWLSEHLSKELNRTAGQLDAVDKVVRNAIEEKKQLQAQLRETITSYTEVIEKLHQQIALAKGGPAATLQLQLHDSRALHSRLQFELQETRQRLQEEQQQVTVGLGAEAEALRSEIGQLRAGIGALSGGASQSNKRNNTRVEELRRLRNDVDVLNHEKEGLERCAQQAEREKQELIDNFLYVKGCLDKLQMASLQTPSASPQEESALSQLRANYNRAVDERNRLAVRVDSLDREREKQKAQREAALERVMTANAKLLEERDKLEREKVRISGLYQQTMSLVGAPDAVRENAGSDASCEALRAEVAQKAELLKKRELESESLRSRLRKLATV